MEYAIKLENGYFKEYIYADKNVRGRFGKVILNEGDIIGVVVTQGIERTEVGRSIGNTITTLYQIESMRGKKIEIIPVSRS